MAIARDEYEIVLQSEGERIYEPVCVQRDAYFHLLLSIFR